MDEENDDIEDAYYAKLLDERKNEPVISLEEFMSRINAKRQKT
jgi:2-methylisocitrate lyase-like PEP mutase family enzyme